jgi:hypothetical protein
MSFNGVEKASNIPVMHNILTNFPMILIVISIFLYSNIVILLPQANLTTIMPLDSIRQLRDQMRAGNSEHASKNLMLVGGVNAVVHDTA